MASYYTYNQVLLGWIPALFIFKLFSLISLDSVKRQTFPRKKTNIKKYTKSKRTFYVIDNKNIITLIGATWCKFTITFTHLLHCCRCWVCVGCGWRLRWRSRSCTVDGTTRPCAAPGCSTSRTASSASWPSSTSSIPAQVSSSMSVSTSRYEAGDEREIALVRIPCYRPRTKSR